MSEKLSEDPNFQPPAPVKATQFFRDVENQERRIRRQKISSATLLTLTGLIAAGSLILSGISLKDNSSLGSAESFVKKTPEEKLTSDRNATPLSEKTTAEEFLSTVGAPDDLKIIFTDDEDQNCGYKNLKADFGGEIVGDLGPANWTAGCYLTTYPNTIFIYWGSTTTLDSRQDTLLHKYAHYVQWDADSAKYLRLIRSDEEVLENDADCWALENGSTYPERECRIDDWSPDYYSMIQ